MNMKSNYLWNILYQELRHQIKKQYQIKVLKFTMSFKTEDVRTELTVIDEGQK